MSIVGELVPEGDLSSSSCSSLGSSQQGSLSSATQSVPEDTASSNSSSAPIASQQGDSLTATQSEPVGTTNSTTVSGDVAVGSSPVSSPQGSASNATQSAPNGTPSDSPPAPNPISLQDRTRHLGFEHYCDDYNIKPPHSPRRRIRQVLMRQEVANERKKQADLHYNDPVDLRRHPLRHFLVEREERLEEIERIRRQRYFLVARCYPEEEPLGIDGTSAAPVSGQNSAPKSSTLSPSSPRPGGKVRQKIPSRYQGLRRDLMSLTSTLTTPSDITSPSPNVNRGAKQVKRKPGLKDLSSAHGPSQGSLQPKPKSQPPSSPTPSNTTLPSPDSKPDAQPSPCKYRLKHPTTPSRKSATQPPSSLTASDTKSPPSNLKSDIRKSEYSSQDGRLCARRKPSQGFLRRQPKLQPSPPPPTPLANAKICIKQGKWSLPCDRSCGTRVLVPVHIQFQFSLKSSSRSPPHGHQSSTQGSPQSSVQGPLGESAQGPPQSSAQSPLEESAQGLPQSPPQSPPQDPQEAPQSSTQGPPQEPPPSPPPSGLDRLKQRLSGILEPKAPAAPVAPVAPLVQAELLYKQHLGSLRAHRSAVKEKLRERAWLQKQLEKSDASQRMLRNLEGAASSTPDMQRQLREEATHFRKAHYQENEGKLRKQLSRSSRSAVQIRRQERSLVCAIEEFEAAVKKEGGTVESWRRPAGADRWKVENADG